MNRRKANGLCVRRANALLALDKGRSEGDVCDFLEIGLTTLRGWLSAYKGQGLSFLELKAYSVRDGHLTWEQEASLTDHLRAHPMRDTNEVRAHVQQVYRQAYSRTGCIKMLHRLGFDYDLPP